MHVMPKAEILDPQGQAIVGALGRLGFGGVSDVRQGERFELEGEGRVVFRYRDNPNGSQRDIAGISSANGRVVGLMPHPEHATEALTGPSDDGLGLFYSALDLVLAA